MPVRTPQGDFVTVQDLEKLTGQPAKESQTQPILDGIVNRLATLEAQIAQLSGQPIQAPTPGIDYNAIGQRIEMLEQLVQSMSTTIHDTHNFIQGQILPQLTTVEQKVNPVGVIVKGPPAK